MDPIVNFFKSRLANLPYSDTDTALDLQAGDASALPDPATDGNFNLVIWNRAKGSPADDPEVEIVRVTAINGDTLTVERGQEGTTATSKPDGYTYEVILAVTELTIQQVPSMDDIGLSEAEMGTKTITNTPAELFAGSSAVSGRAIMKIKVGDSDIRIRIGTETNDLERQGYPIEPNTNLIVAFNPLNSTPLYAVSEGAHVETDILEY